MKDNKTQIGDRFGRLVVVGVAESGPRPSVKHSIERKDNNGPYSPENCKWATAVEQGRNKRNNRQVIIGGAARPASEWAELYGVPYGTFWHRLQKGWEPLKALTFPVYADNSLVQRSYLQEAVPSCL